MWKAKFKKSHLILNFQAMCHTTGNSVLWYTPLIQRHLIGGYTQRRRNDLRTQTTGSNILQSNWNGWGSGSTGHPCPGLKMIHSSRQMHTGTSLKLLTQSASQNHKILKHLQQTLFTDVSPWLSSTKHTYLTFTIQSFQPWRQMQRATPPPPTKCLFNFVPLSCLKQITQSAIIF
jgi:hypothetical protein